MPNYFLSEAEAALLNSEPAPYVLTVRRCTAEPNRFCYVLSPDPDGEAEFVSRHHFATGRDAFRAGAVRIRHEKIKAAALSGNDGQRVKGGPTYGEIMRSIASQAAMKRGR